MRNKWIALTFIGVLILSGLSSQAATKRKTARPEPQNRPVISSVEAFNDAFDVELELVWIRLPQPFVDVKSMRDGLQKSIRELYPFSRASNVSLSVTGADNNVTRATMVADLYEGWSNPLASSLRLKVANSQIFNGPSGPSIRMSLDVEDEGQNLFQSRIDLPLTTDFLQASRKQFIGSTIDEAVGLKTNPTFFPVRVSANEIWPLSKGNHAEGSMIVIVHRTPKNSQVVNQPTLSQKPSVSSAEDTLSVRLKRVALDLDFCTGVRIADRVVLTAAHCLEHKIPTTASWNMKDRIPVIDNFVSLETYDSIGDIEVYHDIALLYLKSPMPSNIANVPLAQPGQKFTRYVRLGYGQRAGKDGWIDFKLPKILKINEVHLKGYESRSHHIRFTQPKKERTCPGDSGGPTLGLDHGKWYVVGLATRVQNNFRTKFGWVPPLVMGKEIPDYRYYCGDFYSVENVSANLDLINKGVQALIDRN